MKNGKNTKSVFPIIKNLISRVDITRSDCVGAAQEVKITLQNAAIPPETVCKLQRILLAKMSQVNGSEINPHYAAPVLAELTGANAVLQEQINGYIEAEELPADSKDDSNDSARRHIEHRVSAI